MPYKNPEDKKTYQREYMRTYKEGAKAPGKTLDPAAMRTAKGLLEMLSDTIAEIRATEADPFVRARCIGYLCAIALRAVEVADLEQRIIALEEGRTLKH